MDDYPAKPVNPEEVKAKLVKWLPADGNHQAADAQVKR
jgi:hypothetical protein